MRREGFELQVSRPEVIIREIDGRPHEPYERVVVDVPDEHVGTVTQTAAPRKAKITDLRPGDTGRTVVSLEASSRGLLGFRSSLMSSTRGTALVHQHQEGWIPWVGELPHRIGGAMIADRPGTATAFALDNLQKRGELFVGASTQTYEGMIIGEASRPEEMVVNPTKAKQLTNIRTHAADEAIRLTPPRELTFRLAIEWIADDELVEVTPTRYGFASGISVRATAPPRQVTFSRPASPGPVGRWSGPNPGPPFSLRLFVGRRVGVDDPWPKKEVPRFRSSGHVRRLVRVVASPAGTASVARLHGGNHRRWAPPGMVLHDQGCDTGRMGR
jgi:hypothetical protein